MKKILFLIVCLCIFPVITHAATCTSSELSEVRTFANNVNIVYEIDMSAKTPMYIITLTNLTNDMMLYDSTSGRTYKGFSANGSELNIKTNKSGIYNLAFYSLKCKEQIKTESITLPTYNIYFNDKLCEGLTNCNVCQKWYNNKNRSSFEKGIKSCKETKKYVTETEDEEVNNDVPWYKHISKIFLKFWWLILILFVLLGAIYYTIRAKQKKNEYDFKL